MLITDDNSVKERGLVNCLCYYFRDEPKAECLCVYMYRIVSNLEKLQERKTVPTLSVCG